MGQIALIFTYFGVLIIRTFGVAPLHISSLSPVDMWTDRQKGNQKNDIPKKSVKIGGHSG